MSRRDSRQRLSMVGNLGLSALASVAAGAGLVASHRPTIALALGSALIGFLPASVIGYLRPGRVVQASPGPQEGGRPHLRGTEASAAEAEMEPSVQQRAWSRPE